MLIQRSPARPIRSASAILPGLALLALITGLPPRESSAQVWSGYGGNPQHTGISAVASQSLDQIVWQAPVDLNPPYSGGVLFIHYGSPLCTAANTIVFPVKTGLDDNFRVEARNGRTGSLLWQFDSDYLLPPHNWTPSFSPVLAPTGRLYFAGAGGTVFYTDNVDVPVTPSPTRIAFYGNANYSASPAAYDSVRICTPLTCDAQGNVFFGFRTGLTNPLSLQSGWARIDANGTGTYVTAAAACGVPGALTLINCAPAISNDGLTVYVACRRPGTARGFLLGLDATTLATKYSVAPLDPHSGTQAQLPNDGTASPLVAPDGKVFFGVLYASGSPNAARGWLGQYTSNLLPTGFQGAFGWDDTPSIVPATMVPSYSGSSSYLLMCKYNFYAGAGPGGNGSNKIAILDPNDSQIDASTGTTVMKEVLTDLGVTPDPAYTGTYPGAVKEWCINAAAVDPATNSVLAGSEDGVLYRWDLTTNTFTQSVVLTPGIGEAYTPTVIAHDGRVYAINNATLFSVGAAGVLGVGAAPRANPGLSLAVGHPNPFAGATTLRFSLPGEASVKLEILDAAGRRVTGLVEGTLAAGEHTSRWDGLDAAGKQSAAGIYFARLTTGSTTLSRKLVLAD